MINLIKPLVIWLIPADHSIAKFADFRKLQNNFAFVGRAPNKRAIYLATLRPEKDKLALRRFRGLDKKYRVYVAPPIHGFLPPQFDETEPAYYVGKGARKD